MAKAIEKRLTIEIEYTDTRAVMEVLKRINTELLSGKSFDRTAFGSCMYQFRKTLQILPEYKEEIINGNLCAVYKSKMNEL